MHTPCDDIKKKYVQITYHREAHHASPFELGEQLSPTGRVLQRDKRNWSLASVGEIGQLVSCLHRSFEALTLHLQLGHIGTVSKEQIGLPRALSITHLLKTELSPED